MDEGLSADSLLQRPVLLRGIRLGHPTDLVLDLAAMRAVALELSCGDDVDRFLPFPVVRLEEGEIRLDSALQLLDQRHGGFYRLNTTSLSSLRGLTVAQRGGEVGDLADVILGGDGMVVELVVEADGGRRRVPVGAALSIGGRPVASAA